MLLQARELLMRCMWKSFGSQQVSAWHSGKPVGSSESRLLACPLEVLTASHPLHLEILTAGPGSRQSNIEAISANMIGLHPDMPKLD